jgi:hypothetical protein
MIVDVVDMMGNTLVMTQNDDDRSPPGMSVRLTLWLLLLGGIGLTVLTQGPRGALDLLVDGLAALLRGLISLGQFLGDWINGVIGR